MTPAEKDLLEKVLAGYEDLRDERAAVVRERLLAEFGSESAAIHRLSQLDDILNENTVEYRKLHNRCRAAGLDATLNAASLKCR